MQTREHIRRTLGVEVVAGMAVGVWKSEGTDEGEGSVEAVSGRQAEGRPEGERGGNDNRKVDRGEMDTDENGMEGWGKEGDTDARGWQGWKGRYLEQGATIHRILACIMYNTVLVFIMYNTAVYY